MFILFKNDLKSTEHCDCVFVPVFLFSVFVNTDRKQRFPTFALDLHWNILHILISLQKDPVILDPSTPPVGIVISDDLTSVEATPVRDPSSPLSNWFAFVLGSKAFGKGCHAWDVHVGNSLDWMVGVASQRRIPLGLAQSSGFWALQRKKDQYQAYISPDSHIPLKLPFSTPLQVVRIKLLYKWNGSSGHTRKVMFSDAQTGSNFLSFILEGHTGALYPFVCPLGQGAKLRIEPIEVKVEVKETLGFWERKGHDILLYGCIGLLLISCIIILVIAAMKTWKILKKVTMT